MVKVLSAVTGTREMDAVPVTFRIMDADREAVPVLIGVLPEVRLDEVLSRLEGET